MEGGWVGGAKGEEGGGGWRVDGRLMGGGGWMGGGLWRRRVDGWWRKGGWWRRVEEGRWKVNGWMVGRGWMEGLWVEGGWRVYGWRVEEVGGLLGGAKTLNAFTCLQSIFSVLKGNC